MRGNVKTGLRAAANDPEAILEAFKPNEEPDDAYSVIGIANATADASGAAGQGDAYSGAPAPSPYETPRPGPPGGLW